MHFMTTCKKCKIERDEQDFVGPRTGRKYWDCVLCRKERNKRNYYTATTNQSKLNYRKSKLETTKRYIYEYLLTHPCVDCKESDPVLLEFDHVNGIKEFQISKAYRRSFLKIKEEIEKCEVRCANCHRRVTEDRNPGWKSRLKIELDHER